MKKPNGTDSVVVAVLFLSRK